MKIFKSRTVVKLRKRREHRHRMSFKTRHEADLKIAQKFDGEIFTSEGILNLFGYSPTTYIHDTTIISNGLVVKLKDGNYKVVHPDV